MAVHGAPQASEMTFQLTANGLSKQPQAAARRCPQEGFVVLLSNRSTSSDRSKMTGVLSYTIPGDLAHAISPKVKSSRTEDLLDDWHMPVLYLSITLIFRERATTHYLFLLNVDFVFGSEDCSSPFRSDCSEAI